jgi:hypothetical protein
MAKAPTSDQIMTADKMKPLLALSKREPVQAAIGLTTDGEGLMLLDKKAKPRKVLAMLRADAAKAKIALNTATLRFGRAEVDLDYDPAMVRLFVNKDAPGNMRIKLVELVKHMSYQKVEINVDPSLEAETDEDAPPPDTAAAAPPAAPEPPPAPPPPPLPDTTETDLRHALATLIARIPAVAGEDAARKATLLKVAGMANDEIKAHDFATAATTIERLRQVLDTATSHPPAGPDGWPAARAAWQEASDTVDGQIAALQAALRATDDADLHDIAEFGLNAVTANHKVPLMAAIREVDTGGPRDKLAKLVEAFSTHIATDERVEACDENHLGVPVSIRATLGPALATMRAALA